MSFSALPPPQGLYDPAYEHDACGVGFLVNIKGHRSHELVDQALQVLLNLDHRGARGAEENSGDGAGVLLQIPHRFFAKACTDFRLPEPGEYGIGMVFLPQEESQRRLCEEHVEQIIAQEGQKLLGWRTPLTDNGSLGQSARDSEPYVRQVFVWRSPQLQDQDAFERRLYIIRRRAEAEVKGLLDLHFPDAWARGVPYSRLYFPSLSSRTIVYKGMLIPDQVTAYYPELTDPEVEAAIVFVHSRFSTNTFPSWDRAHPYRYLIHNGEINTLRGNINWMRTRASMLESDVFGDDLAKVLPVLDEDGSDSAMFDNCLEFLTLAGRDMAHAVMMMIPEPWYGHKTMSPEKKAFYEYHGCLMEPWDGPASIAFTNGVQVGAVLDRNGLRPSRYYVTKDGLVVMASEVGVLPDIEPERVEYKGRLEPGRMLLIDTAKGEIIDDQDLKDDFAGRHPYGQWLKEHLVDLDSLPPPTEVPGPDFATLERRQHVFGYTYEDRRMVLSGMGEEGVEPVGSMGADMPLACLSDQPQLLYNYFKQLFAQVTNPPLDAIREALVTMTSTTLGPERNLLDPEPESCHQIRVPYPVLTNEELARLAKLDGSQGFRSVTLPILFPPEGGGEGLERALEKLFKEADKAIEQDADILILSDRGVDATHAPIPALLAVGGLHHHLIEEKTRTRVGIVLESGEPREVHHFALLIGYGCGAINPYLAFEVLGDMVREGFLTEKKPGQALDKYRTAAVKGVLKTMSKMGISTVQSYRGAQIFEAVGLSDEVIKKYFTATPSRVGGVGLDVLATEARLRHQAGFPPRDAEPEALDPGGVYQWRATGEHHLYNPETIYALQQACRSGSYEAFGEFSRLIDDQVVRPTTLRGLLEFDFAPQPLPLEEVESEEAICRRFKTGAMSYGSISKEAHETLAVAMNRIGGKSNTGEGGEDPDRFQPDPNGDLRCSAIKQVASGRFGVTSEYLVSAQELQIKIAQGAKPGEGGQLPGAKVWPWIATTRHSTTGVGLISPPPHHDIYSIEDLQQLIYDLKCSNRYARISVKLVAEVGVGTIAAGVAKGHSDVILISGHDGGTGASPRSSIRHAGLPWELGLADTHQTLVLNNLRSRVVLETDGKLMTGRDVAIACLLGAEEFGFATAPLVAMGCLMMRVCNLDTCPVGVATQDPDLRKCFRGDPQHVVNFMFFVARQLREIMARLGFRTVEEMVGRVDKLKMRPDIDHWKAKHLDLVDALGLVDSEDEEPPAGAHWEIPQNHGIEESLDIKTLLDLCEPALKRGEKVEADLRIRNTHRTVGAIVGSEVTRAFGGAGLDEDTIHLTFTGSAGQSFGAFVPRGMTLELQGDANDYLGKGLSGGKIIVYPPKAATFEPEKNVLIGNVAFYGATSGQAYIYGVAGERFCVRNSGVRAVVEAVGDHGCEYMTGGRVVVLGPTGRNFAAGMSGGIAYVYDEKGEFPVRCNDETVRLSPLQEAEEAEIEEVRGMIQAHADATGSRIARSMLENWDCALRHFWKVMPEDYRKMLAEIARQEAQGIHGEEAERAAFEAVRGGASRVDGN